MVNGALLMAQIAGLDLHDNWETDEDDAHNEHQPIHENVEDYVNTTALATAITNPGPRIPHAAHSLGCHPPTATERL